MYNCFCPLFDYFALSVTEWNKATVEEPSHIGTFHVSKEHGQMEFVCNSSTSIITKKKEGLEIEEGPNWDRGPVVDSNDEINELVGDSLVQSLAFVICPTIYVSKCLL